MGILPKRTKNASNPPNAPKTETGQSGNTNSGAHKNALRGKLGLGGKTGPADNSISVPKKKGKTNPPEIQVRKKGKK